MSPIDSTSIYGTLNLMILRALSSEELHGLAIQRRIERDSEGRVKVEVGALYPALHRLEKEGLVRASWGVSDAKRRARFYSITAKGRARLERESTAWMEHVRAVARLLGVASPAPVKGRQ